METVVNEWIDYFDSNKSKLEMSFVAPQGIENTSRMHTGGRVYIKKPIKVSSLNRVHGFLEVLKLLLFGHYDFVVCLSVPLLKVCAIIRKCFKRKFGIISWFHFSLTRIIKNSDEKYLKMCDFHLAISSGISDYLIQHGVPKNEIALIYNPSGDDHAINDRKSYLKRRNDGILRLAYVGRVLWNGQKNLQFLLTGLSQFQLPWRLRIIGTGPEPDLTLLKQYVEVNNLSDYVAIDGWQANPFKRVSNQSDFVILTSEYEGLPMVLIEALQRGIPVISSDCPDGTRDVVSTENGYLYKVGDMTDFIHVLNTAFNQKNAFSYHAVRKSGRKFDSSSYFVRVEKAFNQIDEVSRC
ncbi:glycosyltransferase [Lactiplantibacillus plantarum]|uniref:glycosyltransferase n=1 Tax=Lactiplantibacillus plantarum TaxID=1590 RepID=UPI0021F6A81F|nr:glycosyltransferase [Lactiplantibacillus plantarum]MCW0154619.1 glycosyltransferase [Lactiplantibacillus plantarum]